MICDAAPSPKRTLGLDAFLQKLVSFHVWRKIERKLQNCPQCSLASIITPKVGYSLKSFTVVWTLSIGPMSDTSKVAAVTSLVISTKSLGREKAKRRPVTYLLEGL